MTEETATQCQNIWSAMEYQGLHRYVQGNEDFFRFILSGISAMCAGIGL